MKKKTSAQIQREINEALRKRPAKRSPKKRRRLSHLDAPGSTGKTPLYGHKDEATAYVVDDYPYGGHRTQIRYWLEMNPRKGWRFVSQTLKPNTQHWNKPKASTYAELAAAMFLDNKGHVTWEAITPYSDEKKILAFVQNFPGANMSGLRQIIPAKLASQRDVLSGAKFWTINGVRQPVSEADTERTRGEVEMLEEINVWLDQAK